MSVIDLVAIDGPVGVGKSSVAGGLARKLGWQHLDTGAMYRAVALLALQKHVALTDEEGCATLASSMDFRFEPRQAGQRIFVGGEDATEAIRSKAVTEAVSAVADLKPVRAALVARQRAMGECAPSVAEGRDMGTVVFPDARWKFYLDADPRERAQRRGRELEANGKPIPPAELAASIAERDRRDRERPVGALRIADGAILVDTTQMELQRVIAILESLVRGRPAQSR